MKPEEKILESLEAAREKQSLGLFYEVLEELLPASAIIESNPTAIPLDIVLDTHLIMMRAYIGVENMEALFRHYHKLIASTDESDDCAMLSRLHRTFGSMWRNMGLHANGQEECELALMFAEETENKSEIASVKIALGIILSEMGEFADAEEHLSYAISLLKDRNEEWRDPHNLAEAYNNRGLNNEFKGEYTKALDDYNTALDLANKLNNIEKMERVLVNRGRLLARTGSINEAEEDIERALSHNQTTKNNDLVGGAMLVKAIISLARGDTETATLMYAKADEAFANNMNTIHGGMVAYLWGNALLDLGLAEDAEKQLKQALLMFGDAGNEPFMNRTEEILERCATGV